MVKLKGASVIVDADEVDHQRNKALNRWCSHVRCKSLPMLIYRKRGSMKEPIEVILVITEITKHTSFFDFEESEE